MVIKMEQKPYYRIEKMDLKQKEAAQNKLVKLNQGQSLEECIIDICRCVSDPDRPCRGDCDCYRDCTKLNCENRGCLKDYDPGW
jgi:hypothetical protein